MSKHLILGLTLVACAQTEPYEKQEIGGIETQSSLRFAAIDLAGLEHEHEFIAQWQAAPDGYTFEPNEGESAAVATVTLVPGAVFEVEQCGNAVTSGVDCRTYIEAPARLSLVASDGTLAEEHDGIVRAYAPNEWSAIVSATDALGSFEVTTEQPGDLSYSFVVEYREGALSGYIAATVTTDEGNTGTAGGAVAAEFTQ